MNRRTFLLGVCAACSGTPKSEPRKPKRKTDDTMPNAGVRDNTLSMSQTRCSPLAFHGDMLVQSTAGELRAWNALAMQRTETWALPHRHFCFVQDGTLVAFGFAKTGTTLHRIANGKVATSAGPILPSGGTNVVLPARTPDEVYVSAGEHIYLVRGAEVEAILQHPAPNAWNRDQLIGRGDGRIIGRDHDGGFRAFDPKTSVAYPTPGRIVVHLVAASPDRVWYSFETHAGGEGKAQTLVLAPVDKPMTDELAIEFAAARIVHLASHGNTVAALVLALHDKAVWSIVVADQTGERWRADVPDGEPALNHGFVAIGEKRVALAAWDGSLRAWDAATGKPV